MVCKQLQSWVNRLQLQSQHGQLAATRIGQQAIASESAWSASSFKAGSTGYSFRVNMVSQQLPGWFNRLQLQSQHGQLAASRLGQQAIASGSTWSASSYKAGSAGYSFRVNMVSKQLPGWVNRLQLQGQHSQLQQAGSTIYNSFTDFPEMCRDKRNVSAFKKPRKYSTGIENIWTLKI